MSNQRPGRGPGRPDGPRRRRPIAGERKPRPGGEAPPEPTPEGVAAREGAAAPGAAAAEDTHAARETETSAAGETATEPVDVQETATAAFLRRGVPLWALLVLGLVAGLLVAGTAWYGIPRWRTVQEEQAVDQTRRTAPAAAERAAVPILSYDYKSLDTDRDSAARFMTPAYRKQYVKTFDSLVEDNAKKLEARVKATVLASGVSAAEPDRARVLLYVNQTTTSTANGGSPQVALNRVMMDMVQRNGTWLVNDISSY